MYIVFQVRDLFRGIHWWPADSPHKELVMRKAFPFYDFILISFFVMAGVAINQIHSTDKILSKSK